MLNHRKPRYNLISNFPKPEQAARANGWLVYGKQRGSWRRFSIDVAKLYPSMYASSSWTRYRNALPPVCAPDVFFSLT